MNGERERDGTTMKGGAGCDTWAIMCDVPRLGLGVV